VRIGIVGTGVIADTLGSRWTRVGHHVLRAASSLSPASPSPGAYLGPVSVASRENAVKLADAILLTVPYDALPEIGRRYAKTLRGKIVMEAAMPPSKADDRFLDRMRRSDRGTSHHLRRWLPGACIVRLFVAPPDRSQTEKGVHSLDRRSWMLLASEHEEALQAAARLISEADFVPVPVGDLDLAKDRELGRPAAAAGPGSVDLRHDLRLSI
jgi:8-hydroxy-5-deazaflavin:NADPH oxidoreductase